MMYRIFAGSLLKKGDELCGLNDDIVFALRVCLDVSD
jgi:hypothetical protein